MGSARIDTCRMIDVDALANTLGLDRLLSKLDGYDLVDHWQQGEFHHDIIIRTNEEFLVVATNCNGGIKEVIALSAEPDRWALWSDRCPDNHEFSERVTDPLPTIRARARTCHWFDPCELLLDTAKSEIKPSCRKRSLGGGWEST